MHSLFFKPLSTLEISIADKPTILSVDTNQKVKNLWDLSVEKRGPHLFNGRLLSVDAIHGHSIQAHVTEYKYFLAQQIEPTLYDTLKIKPLAVSGVLECADGFVFGLRHNTTQDNNAWELVPSGSIECNSHLLKSNDIHLEQIIKELQEEIGLAKNQVSHINTVALIEDNISHVIDIGIHLKTSLTFDDILHHYQEKGSKEYSELCVIQKQALADFMSQHPLVPVSQQLISYLSGNSS